MTLENIRKKLELKGNAILKEVADEKMELRNDEFMEKYATPYNLKLWRTGRVWRTRRKAITRTTEQENNRRGLKKLEKQVELLNAIEKAHEGTPYSVDIRIKDTGKVARAWLSLNGVENCASRAPGYGYDREGTALSQVLNECLAVRYVLCKYINDGHEVSRFGISGVDEIPYFMHGQGINTYEYLLKMLGFDVNVTRSKDETFITLVKVR